MNSLRLITRGSEFPLASHYRRVISQKTIDPSLSSRFFSSNVSRVPQMKQINVTQYFVFNIRVKFILFGVSFGLALFGKSLVFNNKKEKETIPSQDKDEAIYARLESKEEKTIAPQEKYEVCCIQLENNKPESILSHIVIRDHPRGVRICLNTKLTSQKYSLINTLISEVSDFQSGYAYGDDICITNVGARKRIFKLLENGKEFPKGQLDLIRKLATSDTWDGALAAKIDKTISSS